MALIVDAQMPKNCLSCPSKEHCLAFGKLHFNERLKMLDECRRADNCPIIGEIPDSHGRLIDATELEASDVILIGEDAWNMVHNAPTVLEANNE